MFYITTPIYYVNDEPHLGHAYTTILADVLARYHRLRGEQVFFLTGVDEHGQKVQNALKKRGIETPAAPSCRRTWTRWRRASRPPGSGWTSATTISSAPPQPRHVRVVQAVLQQLWDEGEIYRGEYEGWYCVPDERFWTEKDLVNAEDGEPRLPRLRPAGGAHRREQLLLPHEPVPGLAGGVLSRSTRISSSRPSAATRCWASCASRWATCASRARPRG